MGDVLTLIERAERLDVDEEEESALAMQEKLMTASFTLADFHKQLQQVKKLGSITQVLELAGLGQITDQVSPEEMDRRLKSFEAIINSMTLRERERPQIVNASRRKRIASGSGTRVQDVNQLIKRFQETRKLMKQIGKRGLPGNIRNLFN